MSIYKKGDLELEKGSVHMLLHIVEYAPNAIVSKTIIKKTTGYIMVTSFDAGEELIGKQSSFDIYIQVIDGNSEIVINQEKFKLSAGEGIIIPANSKSTFIAKNQFKMISTVIKSGYEDM
jgi:quercetin dioxygenase-like cupin family protein